MKSYLADTTVLVDHLRGNEKARLFLTESTPGISTVTIAELIQGSRNKNDLNVAMKLCTSLPELVIDKKIAHLALELMKQFYPSKGLRFLDALIAATALDKKLTLVTGNLKHFMFIKELSILSQADVI